MLIGLTSKDARVVNEAVRFHQRHKNDAPILPGRQHRIAAAPGIHKAYASVAASSVTSSACYLDTDNTGSTVTVHFPVARDLADGDLLFVVFIKDEWHCLTDAGGGGTGKQLSYYEIAKTPNMVNLSTTYKLRSVGNSTWANNTDYAVDATANKDVGSPAVNKTYKCILAHKSGGAGVYDSGSTYVAGDRVYVGAGNATTYKAKTSVPINTSPPNGTYWDVDDDEPGKSGGQWATYWVESYLDGYIYAPPYSGNIEEYAPILELDDPVLTIPDEETPTKIWIISPGFIHIALTSGGVIVPYSLWWNLTTRRLMSVFGG